MTFTHALNKASPSGLAAAILLVVSTPTAIAQNLPGDDAQTLQAIEVTGTRIKRAELEGQVPVQVITAADIEATGLGSIGDIIQQLSVSGSSLNTKFNSAGNFGFPPDGGGVGSGSTTISTRFPLLRRLTRHDVPVSHQARDVCHPKPASLRTCQIV